MFTILMRCGRLVALEARIDDPVGAHRKVLEAAEAGAVRVVEIPHAHAEVAGALDDEEAQRAALEHRGMAARVRREVELGHRLAVAGDAPAGARAKAHLSTAQHERARAVGERGVVEDQ